MKNVKKNVFGAVLAGGQGKRFVSSLPKVAHPMLGRPLLHYPLQALLDAGAGKMAVVLSPAIAPSISAVDLPSGSQIAIQKEPRGTAHALEQAVKKLPSGGGLLLVMCGDTPNISGAHLRHLASVHSKRKAAVSVATVALPDPAGYGRIIRDGQDIVAIVEHKNATEPQRLIREINTGVYSVDLEVARKLLRRIRPNPVSGERYLTDLVELTRREGLRVTAVEFDDAEAFEGINDRLEWRNAQQRMLRNQYRRLSAAGVTIYGDVVVEPSVRIGKDTVIWGPAWLRGNTVLGEGCTVEGGCTIEGSVIGDGVHLKAGSYLMECRISDGVSVGPYAHLRPGADLAENVRIGNFVEVKKSRIGVGSKVNHLTYIGDADIGSKVNVGAGTITCNYDGFNKFKTVIGDGAFIGSNTSLIAPVTIGAGAIVGASSAIGRDVSPDALAVARAPQKEIPGYAARKRKENKAKMSGKKAHS